MANEPKELSAFENAFVMHCDGDETCSLPHKEFDRLHDYILRLTAENAEMRATLGPKCPKCGHWLKAEHNKNWVDDDSLEWAFFRSQWERGAVITGKRCITVAELQRDHPDIARELGLEVERG